MGNNNTNDRPITFYLYRMFLVD